MEGCRLFKNIPNVLTISRIAISVWIIKLALCQKDDPVFLLLLAIGAGITDILDGWLAKIKHWETELGAAFDPLADKIFIASMVFTFIMLGYWPRDNVSKAVITLKCLVVIFGVIETTLMTFYFVGLRQKISLAASKWGKWKMRFFCSAAYIWIIYFVFEKSGDSQIPITIVLLEDALLILTISFAGLSLDDYRERYKFCRPKKQKGGNKK